MSVAELLVDVMGPVVAIVAVGFVAGRRLELDVQTLSRLAFWVLGAAFVLDVFADAELDRTVVVRLVVAAIGAMAVAVVASALIGARLGLRGARARGVLMTSAYGNVGNAGLAISVFAFGDDAAPFAAVLMIAINVPGMVLGIALATARDGGIREGVRRALTAPMAMAAVVAVFLNLFDLEFPLLVERSISLLGGALIPVMLLTLGMQLAASAASDIELDLAVVSAVKLALVPVVAAGLGMLLGLEGDAFGALVVQSAMPPAVFCAVIALEFDMDPARVTTAVLGTTVLSLLSLPVVLLTVT